MREKIVYVANDGKEFDTELDCMMHESRNITSKIFFIGQECQKVKYIQDAWFMKLPKSDKEFESACNYLYNVEGSCTPNENGSGYYYWCDADSQWFDINDEINRVNEWLDTLHNAKRTLDKLEREH